MKNMRFSTRLSIYIIALTSMLFLFVFSYNYYKTYYAIYTLSIESAHTLAQKNVEKIEGILQKVEQVPLYIAHSLSTKSITEEIIQELIIAFVDANADIYGATLAVAPNILPTLIQGAPDYFSPYYFKDVDNISHINLASDNYKYWEQDWYVKPFTSGKPSWSDPYFDTGGGNTLMATYSVPIYRTNTQGEKYFFGVITADISLTWLQEIIDTIPIYETGFTSIIGDKGMFIACPNKDLVARPDYTLFHYAKEHNSSDFYQLAEKVTNDESGILALKSIISGEHAEVIYTPLPSTGWSLVLFIPRDEFFAELLEQTFVIVILALLGIVGIVIVVSSISYKATRHLRELSKNTKEIAQGNLDSVLPEVKYRDEIGELATSFDNMRISLKEYIANLTEVTAQQERLESELKIAKNIQASFLPKEFVAITASETASNKSHTIALCASLFPARAVGGDLYDFFYLDENHLFISVGDVSGKGIPAALFMAVTQTLIKSIAKQEKDPASILYAVNNSLAKENDVCMFVTLFCGILHVHSYEFIYTNAGHENPILSRHGEVIKALELPKGLALGIMEGAKYINKSIQLKSCDTILLYTDGVTDAVSAHHEKFGVKNLYNTMESLQECSVEDMIKNIQNAVKKHEQGVEQFDDITLLGLRMT